MHKVIKCPAFLYTDLFSLEIIVEWVVSGKPQLDLTVSYGKHQEVWMLFKTILCY